MTMKISTIRQLSSTGISVAEKIDRHDIWRIRTDMKPYIDPVTEEEQGVSFIEHEFPHKPSIAEVKDFVCSVINAQTDEKILSGFVWNDIHVWLSAENQRNFSEASRMASEGQIELPVTFKLGEDENGEAVYYTFETVEELNDFYADCFVYINQCLNDGWDKKDSIDWTPYEEALNEQV